MRDHRSTVEELAGIVDWDLDLLPYQWAQLFSLAAEFRPDLILELGRGRGNSTCAFTEAAHCVPGTRVVSVCLSEHWKQTERRLRRSLPDTWFEPLTIVQADIRDIDYARVLGDSERVLLFWDAHGFDVAECVLGEILPRLQNLDHVVVMHDLSDARYQSAQSRSYDQQRLWRAHDATESRLLLGNIDSKVEQAIAIFDFSSRNGIELESADHSFHTELTQEQINELEQALGNLFSLEGHWFYFSLSTATKPLTFPRFVPPPPESRQDQPADLPLVQRLRSAIKIILKRQAPPAPRRMY